MPSRQVAVARGEAGRRRRGGGERAAGRGGALQDDRFGRATSTPTRPSSSACRPICRRAFRRRTRSLKREVDRQVRPALHLARQRPQAQPIALMAHQDVVPIAPGTEGDWEVAPFSGTQQGGFVWGRGAWDDKGNLMSIMEAVELRVAAGFQAAPDDLPRLRPGRGARRRARRRGRSRPAAEGARRSPALGARRGPARSPKARSPGLARAGGADRPRREGHAHRCSSSASATPGHSSMPPVARRHLGDRHAEPGARRVSRTSRCRSRCSGVGRARPSRRWRLR